MSKMVTNNSSNYRPTQYNTQTGGVNGTLNDVAPGTAGQVLTSNGVSAQPTYQPIPASGIITLAGDIGTATGSTITLDANTNSGSTVFFDASGSTVDLTVSDGSLNTIIGLSAGNATISGTNNTGLGVAVLNTLTSGSSNTAIGENCMVQATTCSGNVGVGINVLCGNGQSVTGGSNTGIGTSSLLKLTSGTNNACLGASSLPNILTGSHNIGIGLSAGTNYSSSESNNILIANSGTVAESNVLRIGTTGSGTGQVNKTFVAGIAGVTVSNQNLVTIDTSTGQLGSISSTGSTLFTPILQFGGATTGITYSQQYGKYQRIGNCVTFAISLTLTSKGSATGTAVVTNLPIISANDGGSYDFPMTILIITAATATYFFADTGANSITLSLFFSVASTGGFTQLTDTNFANNTVLRIAGSYFV